jgi:hypothetical protein
LYDLVNLTDFIEMSEAMRLYEVDKLKLSQNAVRQENARNYEFE